MSIASRACTPFASLNNQLQHLNKELNRCETLSERVTVRKDIKLIKQQLQQIIEDDITSAINSERINEPNQKRRIRAPYPDPL